jgi:NTE family protein
MVVQAMSLMVAHRFAGEAAAFAGRAKLTILPPPCPIEIQPMDFGHAEELIRRAYGCARFPRRARGPCRPASAAGDCGAALTRACATS